MSIDTWTAAPALRRPHRPAPAAPKPRVIPARKKKPLTAFQQDLVVLRLNPNMRLRSARHFAKEVGWAWEPIEDFEDLRPESWGWEQQQAYARIHALLKDATCLAPRPMPSKEIIRHPAVPAEEEQA